MPSRLSKTPIKVLIVDDHALVREGLRALLDRHDDLEVCGEAGSAAEALALARDNLPDVAVVDLSLREGSGMELIGDLRARSENIRILVSSMHDEKLYAERALEAGAMGYVHKQQGSRVVVDAIRSICSGKLYLSDDVSQRMLTRAARGNSEATSSIQSLTNRELEVFELLGDGHSVKQIATRLHLSPKTVDRYRENIKNKMQLESSAEVLRAATRWRLEQQG